MTANSTAHSGQRMMNVYCLGCSSLDRLTPRFGESLELCQMRRDLFGVGDGCHRVRRHQLQPFESYHAKPPEELEEECIVEGI